MHYQKLVAELEQGDRNVVDRLIRWAALTEELLREKEDAERDGTDEPASAPESKQESNSKPQPESEAPPR